MLPPFPTCSLCFVLAVKGVVWPFPALADMSVAGCHASVP